MHSFTISSIMLALATLGNTAALTKRVQAANGNNDLTSVGKYYGCYTDNVGSRQLARATYADYKQMTQNACIKFCKDNGFPFAGLEFASECWCDYSLGSIATKKDDSECSYTCTGNKNQVCGGYDRLSVFQTTVTSTAPSVNPGPAGWTSLGCYNDNIPGRVLAYRYGVVGGDGAMSVQLCANACKAAGFAYAGVEYSSECYCDNNILSGAQSGQSGCNMLCSGNSTEYCGGSNRVNVYQSTAKAKTAGEIPSGWTAQGCLKDNVLGRALTVAMAVTGGPASMTAEGCVDACSSAGYKIAGVEYSQECWCGNTIQNGGVPTLPSDGCDMPCRGNTLETCGGSNRLNVYANYPLNLVIPSSSTSSSVSTTSATTLSSTTRSSSSSSSAISTTSSSTQTTLSSSSTSSSASSTRSTTSSSVSSSSSSSTSTTSSSTTSSTTSSSSSTSSSTSSTRSTTSSSASSSSSSSTSTSSSTSSSSPSISTSSSSTVAATSTSASPACASPSPTIAGGPYLENTGWNNNTDGWLMNGDPGVIVGNGLQLSGCNAVLLVATNPFLPLVAPQQQITAPISNKRKILTVYVGRKDDTPASMPSPKISYSFGSNNIPEAEVCGSSSNPCTQFVTPLAKYNKYQWVIPYEAGANDLSVFFSWPFDPWGVNNNNAPVLVDDITLVDE